jgi:ring-1,2-phenylacetyl-CoA epoxidase subunit PaaE
MKPILFKSKLLEIKEINPETKILKFSIPEGFNFTAGQYVIIAFYKEGKRILRSYSIFSAPSEIRFIETYFKIIKGGYSSNYLFNMKIGEEIEMKGPLGIFTIKESTIHKDILMISSGTGFAPFMSIVKDLIGRRFKNRMILIRGFRKEEDLCCEEELKKLSEENKNFEYYNILSQPENGNHRLIGHAQDFLEKLTPKDFKGDFYICGLKDMVFETREKLLSSGISPERIHFERYD